MADPEQPPTNAGTGDAETVETIEVDDTINTPGVQQTLASQLMQNPELLAAVQGKLGTMVGQASGYIESLPKVVKRRIKALKKLQFEMTKIEAKFYEEVHQLECKYATQYAPFMERRKDILVGSIEPTDSDCEWPSDSEGEEDEETSELASDVKKKATISEGGDGDGEAKESEEETPSGIPEFWMTTFKNVEIIADMIQPHDEPILKHLQDIKVKFFESDPIGFTLEFYFSPNEFFNNCLLTKHYTMRCEPDENDPFSFEGPEIIKCLGCAIDWKKGKNITVKTIKKKQKHKGRGTTRTVTKQIQNDSFFNFFSPPVVPENEEEEADEDVEAILAADFEIGHFIRDRIVPRAVLYFTGEALEEDDEYEEEEGEEDDEDEDGEKEDKDEEDPDYNPQNDKSAPQECKQS